VAQTKLPTASYVDIHGMRPVKSVSTYSAGGPTADISADEDDQNEGELDGTLQTASSRRQGFNYGGNLAFFSTEEVLQIKDIYGQGAFFRLGMLLKTGLQLLGFKRRNSLNLDRNITNANFVYPDETVWFGRLSYRE
jgi:hypothetical protein